MDVSTSCNCPGELSLPDLVACTTSPFTSVPLSNRILRFTTTGCAMVPWNVSPGFAVSLESRSVTRTWSLVPGGSVAVAADSGSAPTTAMRIRAANRYRQFIRFLRYPADDGEIVWEATGLSEALTMLGA